MEDLAMIKKVLMFSIILFCLQSKAQYESSDGWRPRITVSDLDIKPRIGETCYQYAQRKVNEMIERYNERRIVGTNWLSAYWAHHYEGALIYRNDFWKPI
jgi:hypothetical protein